MFQVSPYSLRNGSAYQPHHHHAHPSQPNGSACDGLSEGLSHLLQASQQALMMGTMAKMLSMMLSGMNPEGRQMQHQPEARGIQDNNDVGGPPCLLKSSNVQSISHSPLGGYDYEPSGHFVGATEMAAIYA